MRTRLHIDPLEARCLLSVAPAAPSGLVATPTDSTHVRLNWTDNARNETAYKISRRIGSSGKWGKVATLPADTTSYITRIAAGDQATYFRVRASADTLNSATSNTVKARRKDRNAGTGTTSGDIPPAYDAPIIITHGGTYTGHWQSLDPNRPAVTIATSEPVVIDGATIRSCGILIYSGGYDADITVVNTRGYGLNPGVAGRSPGRFLDIDNFVSLRVSGNYLEGTAGIYVAGYRGDHSAAESIQVLRNSALNIDGRHSDGQGGFRTGADDNDYVQFVQLNGIHGLAGVEIAWNQVINEPGKSRVEDNISIHNSSGTAASPMRIHDNYIQGAYAADPGRDADYTGGGIMLSDNGSAWVRAYNNQIVSTSNYGIAIASGHDNVFSDNRIVSAGVLADGTRIAAQNVGAYIWNQDDVSGFANNSGQDNVIGWQRGSARNDWWTPDASAWSGNTHMSGPITRAMEAAEFDRWQAKLAAAGTAVGPTNGN